MNSEECRDKIKAELDDAYKWTQQWLLKFNLDKCLVMHYGFNNKKMIEQVQQRATKLIPAIRNLSYENRLRKLELTTLKSEQL
jgi:hypothetical protein